MTPVTKACSREISRFIKHQYTSRNRNLATEKILIFSIYSLGTIDAAVMTLGTCYKILLEHMLAPRVKNINE